MMQAVCIASSVSSHHIAIAISLQPQANRALVPASTASLDYRRDKLRHLQGSASQGAAVLHCTIVSIPVQRPPNNKTPQQPCCTSCMAA